MLPSSQNRSDSLCYNGNSAATASRRASGLRDTRADVQRILNPDLGENIPPAARQLLQHTHPAGCRGALAKHLLFVSTSLCGEQSLSSSPKTLPAPLLGLLAPLGLAWLCSDPAFLPHCQGFLRIPRKARNRSLEAKPQLCAQSRDQLGFLSSSTVQ